MTCTHCGAVNQGSARFCGACGAASSSTEPVSNPSLGEAPQMIGREIAGRYRILAKLGEGGMGAVYRAEQISLKRTVAVKLLRPDVLGNQLLLRRFNAEAELVAKLSHPNTVNIYDFGQDRDGTLFIAMEYIEGRSLRSVLHAEAPLPPRRALAIALQVSASLVDAHAHAIVHRDLKPDNVMLQDRGRERDVARVLDFGIAKLRDDQRATQQAMTQQGDMLGTPQYMAPEQIRAETIDGRTDVYALGCLLYEMVTGRLPHEAPTILALLSKHLLEQPVAPSQRRPELKLSPALDALILSAMAKEPSARPATMELYGEQIAALLATLPDAPATAKRAVSTAEASPRPAALPNGSAVSSTSEPRFDTPMAPSAWSAPSSASAGAPVPVAPTSPVPIVPVAPTALVQPYSAPYAAPPAGYAAPPAGYAAPPAGYAASSVPHAGYAQPSRSKLPIVIVIAVLLVGVGGAAYFATQGKKHDAVVEHDDPAEPKEPAEPEEPPDTPAPWKSTADPWNSSDLEGNKVGVGQGVSVIIPPSFQSTQQNGLTVAGDAAGHVVLAGPITVAGDDPMVLARAHAKMNGLTFESLKTINSGGKSRPMIIFRGTYNGQAIRQVAVPLIGPGYRIAIIFQAPAAAIESDATTHGMLFELFTRRVVVP